MTTETNRKPGRPRKSGEMDEVSGLTEDRRVVMGIEQTTKPSRSRQRASQDEVDDLRAQIAELKELIDAQNELHRLSREQEKHSATSMHEEYEPYDDSVGLLDHPALRQSRPGMAQMWIRTAVLGRDDGSNVFRKLNQRWSPRPADTLPNELRGVLETDFRDQQVIGIHGMILCERSLVIHERERSRTRRASVDQMRSVEERLGRAHKAGDGFTAPRFTERKSTAERGRRPEAFDADN